MSEPLSMAISKHQDYNQDFYAWALENAELIRQKKFSEIDIENVAEELEGMAKSNRRKLVSRLEVLLSHLLKWHFQPERRSNSWRYTIKEQRFKVEGLLKESPSLKYELELRFRDAYEIAILKAARETKFDAENFPQVSPFSLAECLDPNYLPE